MTTEFMAWVAAVEEVLKAADFPYPSTGWGDQLCWDAYEAWQAGESAPAFAKRVREDLRKERS